MTDPTPAERAGLLAWRAASRTGACTSRVLAVPQSADEPERQER